MEESLKITFSSHGIGRVRSSTLVVLASTSKSATSQ